MPINPLVGAEAGIGAVDAAVSFINKIGDRAKQKTLLSQRTAYKTPAEINQILQATQQNASLGLDPSTLDFLNNKTNATFASSLDVIQRLGGDPNAMGNIFGQKVDALGNIAEMDTQARMKNFSSYLDALNSVAANKTAEWKSQQDIIKDKLQAVGVDLNTDNENISGGINMVTGALGAQEAMDLYGNKITTKQKMANNIGDQTISNYPINIPTLNTSNL